MQATLEMSMYPLDAQYKDQIRNFIGKVRSFSEVKVCVNGISTQIFGEFDDLIAIIQSPVKEELEREMGVVFVMKLTSGRHDEEPDI
ncbi:MAG: hypothetical protein GVX96_04450 [Bacteroidetes bacterium]|jgi:uncharacterized protein YqgV (UPF0045/DUF77 family)|nr:hypothetical protein [Bacteroidota bacterium]